jgi:ADP-ribose pyrophosphatase
MTTKQTDEENWMKTWKTLKRTPVLRLNKFFAVETHVVELPDGRVIEDWPWVITPDYANAVAVTDEGRFVVFRQVKYGIEGSSWAPVGGYLEPGEDPLAGAKRELLEETGYTADQWDFLGSYRVDANRGAGTAYFYLARGARRVTQRDADDLEEQVLHELSRAEIETALREGDFKVLAWMAIMAQALRRLDELNPA